MYCPRCKEGVETWKDSYLDTAKKEIVESTLCKRCNAVLEVNRRPL